LKCSGFFQDRLPVDAMANAGLKGSAFSSKHKCR
jgi:hypothetical protein